MRCRNPKETKQALLVIPLQWGRTCRAGGDVCRSGSSGSHLEGSGAAIRWESQWQRGAARARGGLREGIKAGSLKPLGHAKCGHVALSLAFCFQGIVGAEKKKLNPLGKNWD